MANNEVLHMHTQSSVSEEEDFTQAAAAPLMDDRVESYVTSNKLRRELTEQAVPTPAPKEDPPADEEGSY